MVATYKRPGVYLEESLLVNPSDVSGTLTVAAFIGVAEKGQLNEPILVESWSDYVTLFGGFGPMTPPVPSLDVTSRIPVPVPANLTALKSNVVYGDGHYSGAAFTGGQYVTLADASKAHCTGTGAASVWTAGPQTGTAVPPAPVLSYLPYSVYSYFQNGGRFAWIIRAAPTVVSDAGVRSFVNVNQTSGGALTSFKIEARSVGTWGNDLQYALSEQSVVGTTDSVFSLQILVLNSNNMYETVETFSGLSVNGTIVGTRKVDTAVNDPYAGSCYVLISNVNGTNARPAIADPTSLASGVDAGIPDAGALITASKLITKVEGPINLNICGYLVDATQADTANAVFVGACPPIASFDGREDIVTINDAAGPRKPGQTSDDYSTNTMTSGLIQNTGDSYTASYGPWIIIPNPQVVGGTISIPPGGAVMGMMARIDATVGVFRAPAGIIASLSNAVGVQTKFTDSQLGDLNNKNINVTRSVVGAGICVMGGRTRKSYGADKYLSARRTLISIKESLRRSTQWAVFENNDQRLWSGLRLTADRILRPMWEAGGLAGASQAEAYYIRCDGTLNTPNVVQSGEVRMEIGVALEYPAEFVVIRITQFDRGTSTSEVSPSF